MPNKDWNHFEGRGLGRLKHLSFTFGNGLSRMTRQATCLTSGSIARGFQRRPESTLRLQRVQWSWEDLKMNPGILRSDIVGVVSLMEARHSALRSYQATRQ